GSGAETGGEMAAPARKGKSTSRPRSTDHAPVENVLTRLRMRYETLTRSARQIADYVLQRPDAIMNMSGTEVAEATGASEGSVINFCRQLDMTGFQQLKLSLAQETVQPVQFIQEDLARIDSTETICRKIFNAGIQALRDTLSVLDPAALAQ